MARTTILKWIVGISLAGVLLILGLTGGVWGTTYTADAGIDANPSINAVYPAIVAAGSPDKVIVITGSNFGNKDDTGVRLVANGFDQILRPIAVVQDGLSVNITHTLMTEPIVYNLTVVRSDLPSIPTIPIVPIWDHESNVLTFTVIQALNFYLPIISIKP